MPVRCKCGETVAGDVCMLCGESVAAESIPGTGRKLAPESSYARRVDPAITEGDTARRGRLGEYTLDISRSVHIMDGNGNTIYDLEYDMVECSMRLGALRISHGTESMSLRGNDAKMWQRAISYQKSPPVWYIRGAEDCEVSHDGMVLGVTPCVVNPPFSREAFRTGSYILEVSRPGMAPKKIKAPASSGIRTVRFPDGPAAARPGERPEGETLVLNARRSLVLGDVPYMTDGDGHVVLRMPGAAAEISFMKRGATITWDDPVLGKLSVSVRCDMKLKYDRLREMLPPQDMVPAEPEPAVAEAARAEPEPVVEAAPAEAPRAEPEPAVAEPPKKKPWWRRDKKGKWNKGVYEGVDLRVTQHDLDSRLGRFSGYHFECVCSNLLASMGYKIEKGYDAKSGRMLGATRSDKGVDVIAVKKKARVIVQCKHWKEQCGGPDVNKTIGSATTEKGTSVLMMCTGGFSAQAVQIARESSMPVELWNYETIKKNMRRHLMR